MTATLGETYATAAISTAADPTAANPTAAETGLEAARRLSPRGARRTLATRVATSAGSRGVAAAMLGAVGVVALAGALVQLVAG